MPTQLNVVVSTSNGSTVTTTTVKVAIPAGLQALDSGNSGGQGQASQQTGFSSVDVLIRSIFKAGCFFVASTNTWYPTSCIQSISWT
jgi:hypothetical protein